ncbi:MAG: glycoside hydrolase family 28 protein, partial [Terracidiphilus sp.]
PKVSPPDGESPQPVTRLTPHFHDITIENLTAIGSTTAGVIAGLPEAPVLGVVLRNVKISATNGMTISNAEVSGEGVDIKASEGQPIAKLAGAKALFK